MPVTPTPLTGLGSGTDRLTETILLTPSSLTALATARRAVSRHRDEEEHQHLGAIR
jgi:hypothetical protein